VDSYPIADLQTVQAPSQAFEFLSPTVEKIGSLLARRDELASQECHQCLEVSLQSKLNTHGGESDFLFDNWSKL